MYLLARVFFGGSLQKEVDACRKKTGRTDSSQGSGQLTCKFSWIGALRFRVFLAATFLTAFLAWVEARGATGPEDALLLGADFGEIGWPCIMTFFRAGEF
jgi:hypothetical protein